MPHLIEDIKDPIERYFAYARERQSIFLKKEAGLPRPWTNNHIMDRFKITNVFREQDKTTRVVKRLVRDVYDGKPEGLLANVVARWFNRIELIEFIFDGLFEEYLEVNDINLFESKIRRKFPNGPWVTGAYLITTPSGMDKLAGVCTNIHNFRNGRFELDKYGPATWYDYAKSCIQINKIGMSSLEHAWMWLKQVPFLGTFHSHENVIDLRYTKMLDKAPDVNTWTNPGPGAQRGLSQIHGREWMATVPRAQAVQELIQLLDYSRDPQLWPTEWQPWELHQAEMWACEFFKIEKVRLNLGRPRGTYQ